MKSRGNKLPGIRKEQAGETDKNNRTENTSGTEWWKMYSPVYKAGDNGEIQPRNNVPEFRGIVEKWRDDVIICRPSRIFPEDENEIRMS